MALLALHDKRHVLPVLEQHLQGKVKSFVTEKPTTPIASPNMVLLQWRRTQDTTEHVTLEGAVVLGEEAILGCSGWDLLNFMFGSDVQCLCIVGCFFDDSHVSNRSKDPKGSLRHHGSTLIVNMSPTASQIRDHCSRASWEIVTNLPGQYLGPQWP